MKNTNSSVSRGDAVLETRLKKMALDKEMAYGIQGRQEGLQISAKIIFPFTITARTELKKKNQISISWD